MTAVLGAQGRGSREGERSRTALTVVLVVCATVSFLAASVGYWANRNLLTTDVWVDRVAPLSADPDVQAALTQVLTDQLMDVLDPAARIRGVVPSDARGLVPGLTAEFRTILEGYVADAIASPEFAAIWEDANREAHAAAVRLLRREEGAVLHPGEDQGIVLLNLMPVVDIALHRMANETPLLVDGSVIALLTGHDDPEDARAAIEERLGRRLEDRFGAIEVFNDERLALAQRGVAIFDRAFVASVVATVVFVVASLVVSLNRRRTTIALLAGALSVTLVLRLAVLAVSGAVSGVVNGETRRAAVEAVLDAFVDPFVGTTDVMLLAGLLAVAALVAAGVIGRRLSGEEHGERAFRQE